MQLPKELFDRIVGGGLSKSTGAAPARADSPGVWSQCRAVVVRGGGMRSLAVLVSDLSRAGVAILAPVSLPPGEQFVLYVPAAQVPVPLTCVVTRCGPDSTPDGGAVVIVARFAGNGIVGADEGPATTSPTALSPAESAEAERIKRAMLE